MGMSLGIGLMIGSGRLPADVPPPADPPTILSADINAAGTTLTIVFSEAVTGHSGFVYKVNGEAWPITYDSGDPSDTLVFTSDDGYPPQNAVLTLDYTPGNVESVAAGVPLLTVTELEVTNNLPQTILSAELINSNTLRVNCSDVDCELGSGVDASGIWIKVFQGETEITSDADYSGGGGGTGYVELNFNGTPFSASTAYTLTTIFGAFQKIAGPVPYFGVTNLAITNPL